PGNPGEPARHDGVKNHALAFSTLLSSQETDAYTDSPESSDPSGPGRFHSVLQFFPGTASGVKPALIGPLAPDPNHPGGIERPVSRATPLIYPTIRPSAKTARPEAEKF